MSNKIIVPALGESINEATVSKWLKNEGEEVAADEPVVELETDKVNIEVPAPVNGIIAKINVAVGETVNVGAELGSVGSSENNIKTTPKKIKKIEEKIYTPPKVQSEQPKKVSNKINQTVKQEPAPLILDTEEKTNEAPALVLSEVYEDKKKQSQSEKILSPAARKIIEERNIDVSSIEGSGKNGVILKQDLLSLMGIKPEASQRRQTHGPEERVRMSRLRLTIAKRLKEAQNSAAMLTTFNEVDMHGVISMRNDYKEEFQKKYATKLGFMSFFVKACIQGLKNYPSINSEIQNDEIIYKNFYNISIAVGTDKGLIVPVIKNADEMSFADIENSVADLGKKARDGKIVIEDLQGGTFTITNGGIYGSMLSTPILNPPQSAVLGMHNIVERATVVNGEILIRPMMYLALSYDHRIIDGKEAVSFLKIVKDYLEEPRRLFLNL